MSAFTINWLAVLNHVAEGFANGSGFVMALVIWYGVITRIGKKKPADKVAA